MADIVISVISDEIAPDLATAIRFAGQHGLRQIDLRSVDGRNILDFGDGELAALRRQLDAAGLGVLCFASPLLKWLPPGMTLPLQRHDAFGFDAGNVNEAARFRRAFEVCELLGARHVRIFSYLAYDGFEPSHLDRPLRALLALAERHDCRLLMENEPVCNIRTLPALAAIMARFGHPRLSALVDLANLHAMGAPPSVAELAEIAPHIGYLHVKDHARGRGFVPLGDGDVGFAAALAVVARRRPLAGIPLAIETHMPERGWEASAASLAALRGLLAAAP